MWRGWILVVALGTGFSAVEAKTIMGTGASSCGRWTSGFNNDKDLIYMGRMWVIGYLTGMNINIGSEFPDFLKYADSDGISAAISQYCKENPLDSIKDAADDVAVKLIVKANGQNK